MTASSDPMTDDPNLAKVLAIQIFDCVHPGGPGTAIGFAREHQRHPDEATAPDDEAYEARPSLGRVHPYGTGAR